MKINNKCATQLIHNNVYNEYPKNSFQGGLVDSHSVDETCSLLRGEVLLHYLILNTVKLLFTTEHVEK